MSDTVKLIIEIPDKTYHKIIDGFYDYGDMNVIIRNGTPLDDLRADLHATAEMHSDGDYYLRDEWIDEYFDDIGKESEEV